MTSVKVKAIAPETTTNTMIIPNQSETKFKPNFMKVIYQKKSHKRNYGFKDQNLFY